MTKNIYYTVDVHISGKGANLVPNCVEESQSFVYNRKKDAMRAFGVFKEVVEASFEDFNEDSQAHIRLTRLEDKREKNGEWASTVVKILKSESYDNAV